MRFCFCAVTSAVVLGVSLLAPVVSHASAISINGDCVLGSCSSPDILGYNTAISNTTFSYTYTFANSDEFLISGNYSASYNNDGSTSIHFAPGVSFLGNLTNTASGDDLLTINLFQGYNENPPSGTYTNSTSLSLGGFTPESYVESELFYNGESTGLIGPFYGDGSYSGASQAYLSGLSGPMEADYRYTYFLSGLENPNASAATPEPSGFLLLGTGLLGFAGAMRRLLS